MTAKREPSQTHSLSLPLPHSTCTFGHTSYFTPLVSFSPFFTNMHANICSTKWRFCLSCSRLSPQIQHRRWRAVRAQRFLVG